MRTKILALLLLPLAVFGGAVTPTWIFSDHIATPLAVKRVVVTPLQSVGLYNGSNIVFGIPMQKQTDGSGRFTMTNLANGYNYRVAMLDGVGNQIGILTNSFGTNVTGAVYARDYMTISTNLGNGIYAYSMAAADARFQPIGGGSGVVRTNEPLAVAITNQANVFGASYLDLMDGTPSYKRGRIYYDTNQESLAVLNDSSAVTMNVGFETWIRAVNKTGSTIANGAAVAITGAQGQLPKLSLAIATNGYDAIGVATMDITNNATGYVTVMGVVNDVNTSAFNDGDTLYLSSTVAGGLTTNAPAGLADSIGVVVYSHSQHGKILVNVSHQHVNWANVSVTNTTDAAGVVSVNGIGTNTSRLYANSLEISTNTLIGLRITSAQEGIVEFQSTEDLAPILTMNMLSLVTSISGDLSVSGTYFGNGSGLSNVVAAAVSGTLTNNLYASNIVSGGQLALGILATNSGAAGFLTETGDKRKYSLDGNGLTNLNAANLASGTLPNARLGLTVVTNVTLSASNAGIASIAGNVLSIGTNLPASGSSGLASTNGIYYVWNHDVLTNNADNTTAFSNLLTQVFTNGGGTIQFGVGTYTFSNCIEVPYTAGSVGNPARTVPWRIVGQSAVYGQSSLPNGGTILKMLGTNMSGKLVTRGMGGIELANLTFYNNDVRRCTNSSGEYVPFFRTVMTTPNIHHCSFFGPTQGLLAKQDAIKLGTIAPDPADFISGGDTGAFQGYQAIISDNYFQRCRECIRLFAHCNATIIRDNNIWLECGGDSAAIICWSTNGTSNGHLVSGNLIEITSYTNAIVWGTNSSTSVFIANTFYDPTAGYNQNAYTFSNGSSGNVVYSGFIDAGINSLNTNGNASAVTFITANSTYTNQFPNRYLFTDSTPILVQNSSGEIWRANKPTDATNTWRNYIGGSSVYWELANEGAAGALRGTNAYMRLNVTTTNSVSLAIGSSLTSASAWVQPGGVGKLILTSGGTAQELWLGDVTNQRFYILNGVWYRTVSGKGYSNPWGTIFAWTASADQSAAQAAGVTFTNNAAGVGEVRVTGSTINNLTNLVAHNISAAAIVTATNGVTTVSGGMTNNSTAPTVAPSFWLSSPRWVDAIASGMTLGTGAAAPTKVAVDGIIEGYSYVAGDSASFDIQTTHTLATTNATFPNFYYEPHIHISPLTTLGGGATNATFRMAIQVADVYGTYSATAYYTNTVAFTNNSQHMILSFGNITNNALQGKSSVVFRGAIQRLTSASADMGGNNPFVESVDFHLPVRVLGSSGQYGGE